VTTPAQWPLLARLFEELIELEPARRERRLADLRREDGALAAHIEHLLALDSTSGGLLDRGLEGAVPQRPFAPAEGEDLVGQLAGDYRLTARIGRGGMGDVYAAERADGLYRQRVAIKVLASPGPELLRRFDRERAILATLEHPHIARLLDAGWLDARPFLVMELVEGEDLVAHCEHAGADVAARLRLFLDVCSAVAFAHRRLIVHRDLKPSNVLVSTRGEVKLLDFGIAALHDPAGPGDAATTFARRAYTPAYAAPEQVLGQPVTTATDVYALGVLLRELVAGGRTNAGSVPAGATALRGDLAAIVAVATRAEPGARYRSVEELMDDLHRHLGGRPVAARGDDRAYRVRTFARRHRAALAASVLAVGGLVAGLVVALDQAREARSEALRARALRQFLTSELKRERIEQTLEPGGPRLGTAFRRGLPQVDHDFAGQPEVAAEIFSIAGETFRMLGDDARSIAALREALARRLALYGDGDPRVAAARGDLGHALLEHGDLAEAQAMLEAVARPGVLPAEQRAETLSYLGRTYVLRGDLLGAERVRREVLVVGRDVHAQDPTARADALDRLASVLYLEGHVSEAARLLGDALAIMPPSSRRVTVPWLRRAYAFHRQGDLAAAQRAYVSSDAANAAEGSVWANARSACGRALLLAERGDLDGARALVAPELLRADRDDQGSVEYWEAGLPCAAVSAWLHGDLAGLERAITSRGPSVPISVLDRADRQLLRAELLLARGKEGEALALCDQVVHARDGASDLLPWRRAEAHVLRGESLARLGRVGEGRLEIARSTPTLAAALPGHRFLRLVAPANGS